MLSPVRNWTPSFWLLQAGGWTLMYALLLLAAFPHLTERDILRYNTVACAVLFCATLAVRPLCRLATARWTHSWFALESCAFALSLLLGTFASFATGLGTFGWTRLNGSNWMLSFLQCGGGIFLLRDLYICIKHWRVESASRSGVLRSHRQIHGAAKRITEREAPRNTSVHATISIYGSGESV